MINKAFNIETVMTPPLDDSSKFSNLGLEVKKKTLRIFMTSFKTTVLYNKYIAFFYNRNIQNREGAYINKN